MGNIRPCCETLVIKVHALLFDHCYNKIELFHIVKSHYLRHLLLRVPYLR